MKLASYIHDGRASFGLAGSHGIIDIPKRLGRAIDLRAALEEGILSTFAAYENEAPDFAIDGVTLLPPVPRPEKIICVGLNYRDHAAETGNDIPKRPTLFVRFPDSQVGHGQPLVRPQASTKFDYEGEFAVIVGRRAWHVPREAALDYIAGYACFNDGTIRDWQGHTTQFTAGKNFRHSGAMGPWMVTPDAISDPAALPIATRVNGTVVQQSSTAELIFDVPALIEYITTFTELSPGDVIATGTPSGVGYRRDPRLYLKAGDIVEVEIGEIGTLRNTVVDAV